MMGYGVSGKNKLPHISCTSISTITLHHNWYWSFCRYLESGVYHGITEKFLAPKLQDLFDIPSEKLVLLCLNTTSDFKLFRDQKMKKNGGVGKFCTITSTLVERSTGSARLPLLGMVYRIGFFSQVMLNNTGGWWKFRRKVCATCFPVSRRKWRTSLCFVMSSARHLHQKLTPHSSSDGRLHD